MLVSVRSVEETRAALQGGADLIDVKEPSRGPLGAADPAVIEAIVREVAGRVPVSAARGEWVERTPLNAPLSVNYIKWGMANLSEGYRKAFEEIRFDWERNRGQLPVLVAYADYGKANAPRTEELAELAASYSMPGFLIDTAVKDGSTLLDAIPMATLMRVRFRLLDAGVPVALAGSLNEECIRKLSPLRPDWFAVRGAVCEGGREGTVSARKVRFIRDLILECSVNGDSPIER